MKYLKVIGYLILAFNIIACKENSEKTISVKEIIQQVDSLVHVSDSSAYRENLLKASFLLKEAAFQEENNILIKQLQIRTYTFMRAPDSVLLIYQNWIQKEPHSLEANLKRGLLYHAIKKEDSAKADFEVAKKILSGKLRVVNDKMTREELNDLITASFNYFLIGERKIAHKILTDIIAVYPHNERARNALLRFDTVNRDLEISKQIGF